MNEGKASTQDWYVIFTKSKLNHWIFKLINPDMQHCYMVKEDLGLWVIIDSACNATTVRTELVDDYPHIRDLCPNSVILAVSTRIKADEYKWHLGINSCVDVCKGVLGISNWRIFTPYQLYRWIYGKRG
jgi:hypothetical protein